MSADTAADSDAPALLSDPDGEASSPELIDRLWKWRYPLLAATTLVVVVAGLAVRSALAPVPLTPGERFSKALELADKAADRDVRNEMRAYLHELELAPPDPEIFGGGIAYLNGVVAFYAALSTEERFDDSSGFALAAKHLIRAERQALPDTHRKDWARLLGLSLRRSDRSAAVAPLTEAWKADATDFVVGLALLESVLGSNSRDAFDLALKVSDKMLRDAGLADESRAKVLRARCDLALRTGDLALAKEMYKQLPDSSSDTDTLFEARLLMGDQKWRQAISRLEPLKGRTGLDRRIPGVATLLLGRCELQDGNTNAALDAWQSVTQKFPETSEAVAAGFWSAEVLQDELRHEEALQMLKATLELLKLVSDKANPWLSRTEMQASVFKARDAWVATGDFRKVISLFEAADSLLSKPDRYRGIAEVRTRWAEFVSKGLDESIQMEHRKREEFELWAESGNAWNDLAELLIVKEDRSRAIWNSAEHYINAHQFTKAKSQLERFLESHSGQYAPSARLRLGKSLMALDELDDAHEYFKYLLINQQDSPLVYEARYWSGRIHLEADRPDDAEREWNKLIESPDLDPNALEWRWALLALGELQYLRASGERLGTRIGTADLDADAVKTQEEETDQRFTDAADKLRLFLRRFPDEDVSARARYYLGRCRIETASARQRKADAAETDNAKADQLRRRQVELAEALKSFDAIIAELEDIATGDHDSKLERGLYKQSLRERAGTLKKMARYGEAIDAYNTFVNQFPNSPTIVMAYLQMAECHDSLNRPDEASGMRQQARLVLNQLPEEAFAADAVMLPRADWKRWIERTARLNGKRTEN